MKSNPAVPRLGWHFDLHTPGYVRVNENPDVKGIARGLKEAGVGEVITFAKCHFGFSYYPTKVGNVHPKLKGDAFGSVLKACRAQGIKVIAYISFGIDGEAGSKNPDWRRIFVNGKGGVPGGFISMCPFTPYFDELMVPQIQEVIKLYRPDGFWFDTMGALNPCYCSYCKKAFQKEKGKEIPIADDDPLNVEYGKWRYDRGIEMLKKVDQAVHRLDPNMDVAFNRLGGLTYPEYLVPGINVLSLDPPTHGPQSLQFSAYAAFGSTTGMPSEVMPTIYNQGWGDWSLASEIRLEQVAVTSWARGAKVMMGDRLHPENRFTSQTAQALKIFGKLLKKIKREFPKDARLTPDAWIVHSQSMLQGDQYETFAKSPNDRLGKIHGAHRLHLDAGSNFTIISEGYLTSSMSDKKFIVLPELTSIRSEIERNLKKYVQDGGTLLIVGAIPKVNGKLMDWLGVQRNPEPWQDHIYLPSWKKGGDPVLIRGDFYQVKLSGAVSCANAIPAYDAQYGKRYGWGIGPACSEPSEHPALTCHQLGKGQIWHLGAPIFSDYAKHGNWQQIEWFRELLHRLKVPYRSWLKDCPGNVELVQWESEKTSWMILIQHRNEQGFGTSLYGSSLAWQRSLGPVSGMDLTLAVNSQGRKPKAISSAGKTLKGKQKGSTLNIPIHLDSIWKVVRVDWK